MRWNILAEKLSLNRTQNTTRPHQHCHVLSQRLVMAMTLAAFGYLVIPAADGAQAITLFAEHRGDIRVVITDLMMPVMDGPTTIRILRQLDPELPVIGASGMSASEKVGQAMAAGARHFVPKPYTAETLLTILRDVLRPEG